MGSLKDRVAIVGMGCTKFGEQWDKSTEDLAVEALFEALEDAGIEKKEIEACYLATSMSSMLGVGGAIAADSLKLRDIPIIRNENYCTSGHIALLEACMAVASGAYETVLALGVEKLKDTGYPGLGAGRGIHPIYEARRTSPGSFGLIATRYFEQYGLSPEEGKITLAKIEVKNHDNGSRCPKAHFKNKITIEQVMKAPIIAWPLGLFDCCGNSDGGACAIVTTPEKAKALRPDPIYLKGFGIAMDAMIPHFRPGFSWTSFNALIKSSAKAYEMAGIKNPREELSLAEVHDCFSITELLIYEDFGFSKRGRAKEDIDAGFFERDGGLPVNVDGGLKCFGHPVGASGLRMTYEIYKQLQGKADLPERQIKNPRLGLANTFGGPPQISAVAIFGNEK
jgi:acetyl-CoA C-acetyltransferase